MSVAAPASPVSAPSPTASPVTPARAWTTPRLLQASLGAVWLGAFLLFLAVFAGARQHYGAVKTVGVDAAPSIVAAQQIKAALADMDANVANELIAKPGQNLESDQGYEKRRVELSRSLVHAAENITYGDAERVPIQTLTYNLGSYESLVAQARLLHGRGGDAAVLTTYRQADQLMHTTLLPAADALDEANNSVLTRTYAAQESVSALTAALVWVVGLLLLAVLAAVQVFLSRRMRRTFNPFLLAAAGLTLLFLLYSSAALSAATRDLKSAKQDAFDSVYALWHTRAVAYDANADESRWLIDRAHAAEYQQGFFDKAGQLATVPPGSTYDSVAATCQNGGVSSIPADSFHGFLADELRNITFVGEQDVADETLRDFGRYVSIDGQIRALQQAGKHGEAVALCTGDSPGQSNYAYGQFDDALGRVLDINEKALSRLIGQAFGDLKALPILAPTAMLLTGLLTWFGLMPRLREFSG